MRNDDPESSRDRPSPARLLANPAAMRNAPYPDALRAILSRAAAREAFEVLSHWPGYQRTPLARLSGLARELGIASLLFKDESERFGLKSFKALGGAYALFRLLAHEVGRTTCQAGIGFPDLISGKYRAITSGITVTCATDGNHGCSVAWAAHLLGCRSIVYVHSRVSPSRKAAIAAFGAEVIVVEGTYDDSVRRAAQDAAFFGRIVVSDTSYEGYAAVPRLVMQGYSVLVEEVVAQMSEGEHLTHVFVQAGVGGLAAALVGHIWESWGVRRPLFVVVEPFRADCLFETAKLGALSPATGDLDTVMAGLSAGEASALAWEVLRGGADFFLLIDDDEARPAMSLLARGVGGDIPMVSGESGAAGLAGLAASIREPGLAEALGLNNRSSVLLVGTEGDTDPISYQRAVGRTAAEVKDEALERIQRDAL